MSFIILYTVLIVVFVILLCCCICCWYSRDKYYTCESDFIGGVDSNQNQKVIDINYDLLKSKLDTNFTKIKGKLLNIWDVITA